MKTIVALSVALLLMATVSLAESRRPVRTSRPAPRSAPRIVCVTHSPTTIGIRFRSTSHSGSSTTTASASSSSTSSASTPSTPPPILKEDPPPPTRTVEVTNPDGSVTMKEVPVSSVAGSYGPSGSTEEDAKQKSRDDNFARALQEYKKDFPDVTLPSGL